MANKTIHIANPYEFTILKKTEIKKKYLENFVETIFINLNKLNPTESLTIDQFSDKNYLREFEKTFLKSMNRVINTGTYQRFANELELKYTITLNM